MPRSNSIYKLGKEKYLIINNEVLESISTFAQHSIMSPEQGGVLIGQYRGEHIRIDSHTTPQPEDIAKRCLFVRRSKKHIEIVKGKWRASNTLTTFIGEWHTHPEDHPRPSSIDVDNWKRKLPRNYQYILIIQGRKSIWIGRFKNGCVHTSEEYKD